MLRLTDWLPTTIGKADDETAFDISLRIKACELSGENVKSQDYYITVDQAIDLALDLMKTARVEEAELQRRLRLARSMTGLGPQ